MIKFLFFVVIPNFFQWSQQSSKISTNSVRVFASSLLHICTLTILSLPLLQVKYSIESSQQKKLNFSLIIWQSAHLNQTLVRHCPPCCTVGNIHTLQTVWINYAGKKIFDFHIERVHEMIDASLVLAWLVMELLKSPGQWTFQ